MYRLNNNSPVVLQPQRKGLSNFIIWSVLLVLPYLGFQILIKQRLKPAWIIIFYLEFTFCKTWEFFASISWLLPSKKGSLYVSFLLLFILSLPTADFLPPLIMPLPSKFCLSSWFNYIFCLLLCTRHHHEYTWMRLI